MAERAQRGLLVPRLREVRMRRAMNQPDLAEAAKCSRNTVNRGEAGHPIDPAVVRRLAAALGVEPADLTAAQESGQ